MSLIYVEFFFVVSFVAVGGEVGELCRLCYVGDVVRVVVVVATARGAGEVGVLIGT